jgi:hypothetical protein
MRRFLLIGGIAVFSPASGLGQQSSGQLIEERRWGGTLEDSILSFAPTSGALHTSGTFALTIPQISRVLLGHLSAAGLASLGRPGRGPGEYLRPGTAGWLGDSLWIWDPALLRLTWLNLQGQFLGSQASAQFGAIIPLRSGHWYRFEPAGLNDTTAQVWLLQPNHTTARLVAAYAWPKVPELKIPSGGGFIVGMQPFGSYGIAKMDPSTEDLLIFEPRGQTGIRFRRLRSNGAVVVDRIVPLPTQPMTTAHFEAAVSRWMEGGGPQLRALPPEIIRRALYKPAVLPIIRGVIVATDGTVWLKAGPESSHLTTWVVLSSDGRSLRRLTGPAGLQLLAVDGGHALGAQTTEDGMVALVRLRLPAS